MPLFAQGRTLAIQRAAFVVRTASGAAPVGFAVTVDGAAVGNTVKEPTLGDLPTTAMPPTFAANLYGDHVLTLTAAGNLAPSAPAPGNVSAIDPTLLLDLMIYIEYRFQ